MHAVHPLDRVRRAVPSHSDRSIPTESDSYRCHVVVIALQKRSKQRYESIRRPRCDVETSQCTAQEFGMIMDLCHSPPGGPHVRVANADHRTANYCDSEVPRHQSRIQGNHTPHLLESLSVALRDGESLTCLLTAKFWRKCHNRPQQAAIRGDEVHPRHALD